MSDSSNLLFVLAAVVLATRLLGAVAQRFGRPAVLGELAAGVLLGSSVLGIYDPRAPVLQAFAQLGVLILLFQIGLSTDLQSLRRVAASAMMVAAVGVLLPFAGGVALMRVWGVDPVGALVVGAALTPTSVGISARVLNDLRLLQGEEGQVVLGAAVFDDVIGLVILSIISVVVGGGSVTYLGVARTAGVAVGFIAVALLMGSVAIPPLFRAVERIRSTGSLGLIALAFAFALAWLAAASGSAMLIGAFAAGLILHPTPQRRAIEESVTALGHLFVPIFFAGVGAAVELRSLASPSVLLLGGALLVVGAAGKIAAGFSPWWFRGHKMLIGAGMLPRGEVELIIAQMALAAGAISASVFGALMLVVAATALISPLIIERVARASAATPDGLATEGGIENLVAGAHHEAREARPASTKGDPRG